MYLYIFYKVNTDICYTLESLYVYFNKKNKMLKLTQNLNDDKNRFGLPEPQVYREILSQHGESSESTEAACRPMY